MTIIPNALLDLNGVSSRAASWVFELYEAGNSLGTLQLLDRQAPPALTVDVSRAIKRTLTGLSFLPDEVADINVIKASIKLSMQLSDGTMWPQGVFLFSDVSRNVVTNKNGITFSIGEASLVDQLLIVDQELDRSVSYSPGTVITDAIGSLLAELPITYEIQPSSAQVNTAEAISWTIGTRRLRIINELAMMIGYHDLYFDNNGMGRLGPVLDPDTVPDDQILMYRIGQRTFLGSVTRSTNILDLPNRFVVVNNGPTDVPVVGTYDIPPGAPHSFENRGFFVTRVELSQGIASDADADYAALQLSKQWRFPFETIEFSGPPDPRHDHYQIVDFEGQRLLELNWNMTLVDGSDMTHTLRRISPPQPGEDV